VSRHSKVLEIPIEGLCDRVGKKGRLLEKGSFMKPGIFVMHGIYLNKVEDKSIQQLHETPYFCPTCHFP
jgi:hypothetical protein